MFEIITAKRNIYHTGYPLIYAEVKTENGWLCLNPLEGNPEYDPEYPEAVNQRALIHKEFEYGCSNGSLVHVLDDVGVTYQELSSDLSLTMIDTYASYDKCYSGISIEWVDFVQLKDRTMLIRSTDAYLMGKFDAPEKYTQGPMEPFRYKTGKPVNAWGYIRFEEIEKALKPYIEAEDKSLRLIIWEGISKFNHYKDKLSA